MSRWFWKRAALAIVAGLGLAVDTLPAADKGAASYQSNDVIVLKLPGRPDQKVTVLRTARRTDGRLYTEVRDAAGKVFTMIDEVPNGAADRTGGVIPASGKDATKVSPRENGVPPASAVAMADKRRRIFGRDDDEPRSAPAPAAEPEKKPGLLSRIFGKDKEKDKQQEMTQQPRQPYTPQPTYTPQMPPQPPVAAQPTFQPTPATPSPMPLVGTTPSAPITPGVPARMPTTPGTTGLAPWTPVRSPEPTPPVGVPPVKPTPGVTTGTTRINLTPDGPKPVAPAVTAPAVTAPTVTSPSVVVPQVPNSPPAPPISVPAIPVAPPIVTPPPSSVPFPPQVSIPALPAPAPSPQSKAKPLPTAGVRTVGHVETREEIVVLDEVKAELTILQKSRSAAERLIAVRSLANGHYGWRAEVKGILLETAYRDSAPAVRAQCITELRELGYYNANFLMFLEDCHKCPDAEVRDAAKAALAKLNPQK